MLIIFAMIFIPLMVSSSVKILLPDVIPVKSGLFFVIIMAISFIIIATGIVVNNTAIVYELTQTGICGIKLNKFSKKTTTGGVIHYLCNIQSIDLENVTVRPDRTGRQDVLLSVWYLPEGKTAQEDQMCVNFYRSINNAQAFEDFRSELERLTGR